MTGFKDRKRWGGGVCVREREREGGGGGGGEGRVEREEV